MTVSMERKSYARLFVEIDVSKELKKEITLNFSKGKIIKQKVVYEFVPSFCKKCNAIGHDDQMCNDRYKTKQFKANYERKGKGVVNEGPPKSFVDDRHRVGEGVPNPNTTTTTRTKASIAPSNPRGTNRGKRTYKPKYVEVNKQKAAEKGVPVPSNVASTSKGVAQPEGRVVPERHEEGDRGSKGLQNPREGGIRDEERECLVDFLGGFLKKLREPKTIDVNPGAICEVDDPKEGDRLEGWTVPNSKKHRRRKKGGNSSNQQ